MTGLGDRPATTGAVVVAYRSENSIVQCLRSILADAGVRHVAVVDNSATPHCADVLEAEFGDSGRLTYRHAPENLGFARGCNLGAGLLPSDCEYIAFVNPDVLLTRPLSELARTLDDHGAAVVSAGLTGLHHPGTEFRNARRMATPGRELVKVLRGSGSYLTPVRNDGGWTPVDQADGALLVMSASVFASLAGFDERYELYYEDVDLCRAAAQLGGCGFAAAPWGSHLGGQSSSSVPATAYLAGRISRMRYLRKHSNRPIVTNAFLILLALAEFVTRTVTRSREGFRIRSRGLLLQLRELRRPGSVRVLRTAVPASSPVGPPR